VPELTRTVSLIRLRSTRATHWLTCRSVQIREAKKPSPMLFMVNRLLPTQPIATAPQAFRQSIASPTIPRALRQFDRGSKYCQSCTWRREHRQLDRATPAKPDRARQDTLVDDRQQCTWRERLAQTARRAKFERHPQEIGGRRHRRHRRPAEDLLRVLSGGPYAMRPAVECDGRVAAADGSA